MRTGCSLSYAGQKMNKSITTCPSQAFIWTQAPLNTNYTCIRSNAFTLYPAALTLTILSTELMQTSVAAATYAARFA